MYRIYIVLTFLLIHADQSSGQSAEEGLYVPNGQIDRIETMLREQKNRIQSLERTVGLQNEEIKELNKEVNVLKKKQVTCQNEVDLFKEMFVKNSIKTKINTSHNNEDIVDVNEEMDRNQNVMKNRRLLVGSTTTTKRPTAFYAYMKKNEVNPSQHHSIIFDMVKTNINGGYSPFSGLFTAPEDGVYVFTFSIRARCKSYGAYELVKNAEVQNVIIYNDHDVSCVEDHATGITVLAVNQGDEILVRTHSTLSHSGDIWSDANGYSSFSGWLISP